MQRVVVLLHTLPDGSSHFDWMTERDGVLVTFRLARSPAEPGWTAQPATRLPDHRLAYLTFEGEIAGGRGTVRRVASGGCERWAESADRIEAVQCLGGVRARLCASRGPDGSWEIIREKLADASEPGREGAVG